MKEHIQTKKNVPLDKRVYDKAVDYLYQNLPTTMLAQSTMPVFIYVVLWSSANHVVLSIWTAFNILFCLIDYLLYRNYKKKRCLLSNPQQWGNYYALNSLAMGLLNGIAVFLFFSPDSVGIQAFLITVILGYSAGAMVMNAYWVMSSYLLAIPVLSLAALRFFMEGDIQNIGIAILLLLYLGSVISYSQNIFRSVLETIELQFEISDLSQQFLKQKELAEEANLSKSKFLAAASHDLRQPLHAMEIFTNLLENKLENDTQKKLFSKVTLSLDVLRDLLNILLDVSKLDAGVVEKNLKHFYLHNILNRLVLEFSAQANEKGLILNYTPTNIVIYSDASLVALIIRNLISNAIRYTEQGEVTILLLKTNKSELRVTIKDTGIGIAQDKQEKIFHEFHQIGNPERDRVKGFGLGLAIVKRLSGLLSHKIEIESKLGKGSKFTIIIPIGDVNKVLQSNVEFQIEKNISVEGISVVCIEDEIQILEAMSEALTEWGCNVLAATSEKEAIKKIKEKKFTPQVIITDYRLREDKTGVGAINAIRTVLGFDIPALIITGDTAPERLREAKASGYDLLHKPVKTKQILAFIKKTVTRNC